MMSSTSNEEKKISCFLCGVVGYHKDSEEFTNHLMHQHGVVFDDGLDFIHKLSQYKHLHRQVPDIKKKSKPRKSVLCKKCRDPPKAEAGRAGGLLMGEDGLPSLYRAGGLLMGEDGLPSLYGWTCRCALCDYTAGDDTTFWSHITKGGFQN